MRREHIVVVRERLGAEVLVSSDNKNFAQRESDTLPELTLAAEEIRRAASSITRVADNLDENPSILTPQSPRPTVELEP